MDNILQSVGIQFCRYADDIILFGDSQAEVRKNLQELAKQLDTQQRLQLQRLKTRSMNKWQFMDLCDRMLEDRPINMQERSLLEIIEMYTDGDPYATVWISEIEDEDLRAFDKSVVESILSDYVNAAEPDYSRLRWFLRRLAQVGHPAAVDFCLVHFDRMRPAIGEICRYFVSVSKSRSLVGWRAVGEQLIRVLEDEYVQSNEYATLSVMALFGQEPELNHLSQLLSRFDKSSPLIRREIILAAVAANAVDWLRSIKDSFQGMDAWNRSAFLLGVQELIPDERKFFLTTVSPQDTIEELLIGLAK